MKTWFHHMVTMIESLLTIINDVRLLVTSSGQSRTVTLTFGMIHGWKTTIESMILETHHGNHNAGHHDFGEETW